MIRSTLEKLLRREDLTRSESVALMTAIMSGNLAGSQIAAVLTALRMKGETVAEITGFATAMRGEAVPISPSRNGLVDTCGTGGDARHTFNISTSTALVAAAMDIPVAKHGNRAVSSSCGSADVLEELGINLDLSPTAVAELIDEVGIGFLFAPQYHPAMKHAAPVRKQLGVRTIFNLLGPLTNPAGVKRQVVGVFAESMTEPICRVLGELGAEKAFVVCGRDGTDEVSITAETVVSELREGQVRTFEFTPEEAGLRRAGLGDISGGSAAENAGHLRDVLAAKPGPRLDAVLLNAGFVALVADRTATVAEGVELARHTLESGRGSHLLENLCRASAAREREAS